MMRKLTLLSATIVTTAMHCTSAVADFETTFTTRVTENWQYSRISGEYRNHGAVFSQLISANDQDGGTLRLSGDGKYILYQEEYNNQANEYRSHANEDVDLLGISGNLQEQGIDGEVHTLKVTTPEFTVNFDKSYTMPLVFTEIRSYSGDVTTANLIELSADKATFRMVEGALDDATYNGNETVHILVIEEGEHLSNDNNTKIVAMAAPSSNEANVDADGSTTFVLDTDFAENMGGTTNVTTICDSQVPMDTECDDCQQEKYLQGNFGKQYSTGGHVAMKVIPMPFSYGTTPACIFVATDLAFEDEVEPAIETFTVDNVTNSWKANGLSLEAQEHGILLAQAVTKNDSDIGNVRIDNKGLYVRYQEASNSTHSSGESIDLIAIKGDLRELGVPAETHSISATDGEFGIELDYSYSEPLVFAQVRSHKNSQPVSVMGKVVGNDYASFVVAESNYFDGSHKAEIIDILVIESGTHTLSTGAKIVADYTTYSNRNFTVNTDMHETSATVCQIQPPPGCTPYECSVNAINYNPGYNGTRVIESTDSDSSSLTYATTETLLDVTDEARTACLIVSNNVQRIDDELFINGTGENDIITSSRATCSDEDLDNCINVNFNGSTSSWSGIRKVHAKGYEGYDVFNGIDYQSYNYKSTPLNYQVIWKQDQ